MLALQFTELRCRLGSFSQAELSEARFVHDAVQPVSNDDELVLKVEVNAHSLEIVALLLVPIGTF